MIGQIEQPGETLVPADKFRDIVRESLDDTLAIEIDVQTAGMSSPPPLPDVAVPMITLATWKFVRGMPGSLSSSAALLGVPGLEV